MNTASGQLVKCSGDFPDGAAEPADGNNHELVKQGRPLPSWAADALLDERRQWTGLPCLISCLACVKGGVWNAKSS
jgi:hypothetical protein